MTSVKNPEPSEINFVKNSSTPISNRFIMLYHHPCTGLKSTAVKPIGDQATMLMALSKVANLGVFGVLASWQPRLLPQWDGENM